MKKSKKTDKESSKVIEHVRTPIGNRFAINQGDLEGAAIEQLELMAEYGELAAQAEYEVARLEERKKTIRSRILLSNQSSAKNAQMAEALYRVDPEYQRTAKLLNEAIYRKELMKNAMFSLSQRRDMIDLYNKRQLATNGIQTGRESARKRVNERTKTALNKKKKG